MQNYKLIILGPPLVGKTTLLAHLRHSTSWPLVELDEELLKLNGGVWPEDSRYRNGTLVPQVIAEVLSQEPVIFLTSTIDLNAVRQAKEAGFKLIQLELGREELLRRNEQRMKAVGAGDAREAIEQNVSLQRTIKTSGLVDATIHMGKDLHLIEKEIRSILSHFYPSHS